MLGLVLSVFHNRRWDSDFLILQELLKDGTLGEIVSVESHFDRHRPFLKGGWREKDGPGSGVLYDLGSHLLDQSFQAFGLPKTVLADLRQERAASQATDGFLVLLEYQNIRVELKVSCLATEPPLRFKVRGTQGTWVQHGYDPQEEALRLGERPGGPAWGEVGREHWGRLYRHQDGGGSLPITAESYPEEPGNYLMFYSQLAKTLATGCSLPVLAIEARNVIRAIELCLESHQKRRWVDWR